MREADRSLVYLRCEVERYQKQEKDYETMRKLRKIMSETSSELMRYKSDLEAQSTPPEEMAKLFYDMLMMKNLEVLKAKDKLNEFPDKINEKEHEIVKLKSTLEAYKKEIKDNFERKAQDKRKYEDLKSKYRTLLDKAKQKGLKGLDISEMDENSQTGLQNLVPQTTMIPEPIMQETLRKPAFNSNASGKIGGFVFKKKAESSANVFA
jgi:chromosome segregation ATPase